MSDEFTDQHTIDPRRLEVFEVLPVRDRFAGENTRPHAAPPPAPARDVCPKCGETLRVGEWPFCPHGFGANSAIQDEFIGGLTLDNLGPTPVTVYSRSELRRELAARGLEERVRHVPVPGTDRSPHTTNWAAPSAYMLEQGRILAERQAHTHPREGRVEPDAEIRAEVTRAFQELSQ